MTQSVSTANLLLDFGELEALLRAHLEHDDPDPLDTFLLAAALSQIVDDYVHRDPLSLGRVARRLPTGSALVLALRRQAVRLRSLRRRERAAQRLALELAELVDEAAEAYAAGGRPSHELPATGGVANALRDEVVKLPNCFRSFDQHPDDCTTLARELAARHPDRDRPVLVVGIRTSGSYLAPLTAASLRAEGFGRCETMTFRPEQPLVAADRKRLRAARLRGALVAVVDDPPRTGGTLAETAAELVELGVARESLVLTVALLDEAPPDVLRPFALVALPWSRWSFHDRLAEPEAAKALSQLLESRVGAIRRVELSEPRRGHARALYEVELDGRLALVHARGVGLGYLGRQAGAVAEALASYLPRVHGLCDGILYREWLSDDERVHDADATVARLLGRYVAERAAALRVARDPAPRVEGRDALWEVVSSLLQSCFGRIALIVRPLARAAGRALTATDRPSVVDGATGVEHLFLDGGKLQKVGFEEHPFVASGLNPWTFDPVFDLAVASASTAGDGFAAAVREEFAAASGRSVSPERLFSYRLAHDRARRWHAAGSRERLLEVERSTTRAAAAYFAERFLADLEPPNEGELCAVDVDGVLETRLLVAPAIGPDAALAIRAFVRHGFRPVIVTGRSLTEVRERCRAYGLAGGVAEYGAFVVGRESRRLLEPDEEELLAAVRAELESLDGIVVDGDYIATVRAYAERANEPRGPLPQDAVDAVLAAYPGVSAIRGDYQTDFVARTDKGVGLAALSESLGAPVAVAIGDSAADVPMLRLARAAFAPAGAGPDVAAVARVMRRPYQAGLLDAAAAFLGHRPERCRTCAMPEVPPEAQMLLAALRAKDGGAFVKLRQATKLARSVRRGA
jgi:hydroxymethylpyrimidine pyrophosphatase-like HAD family hydrolase